MSFLVFAQTVTCGVLEYAGCFGGHRFVINLSFTCGRFDCRKEANVVIVNSNITSNATFVKINDYYFDTN